MVCDNPLEAAESGDWCFVEDSDIMPYITKVEKIIIYRWNRTYPADRLFPLEITESTEIGEFKGLSHEKIKVEEVTYD